MTVTEDTRRSHYERIGGAASGKTARDVLANVPDQVVTSAMPQGV
ncbi:hypothetical protein ONA70_11705 [Micromonospora yasonensis]|nr:hypothetical protein [Micromonospora yasonensis]MCW3840765.1 hypothetical protein [Micromonospora yasonensis]